MQKRPGPKIAGVEGVNPGEVGLVRLCFGFGVALGERGLVECDSADRKA
jgi:hypothetical protein